MYFFDQRTLGIIILLLLGMLVIVKQMATGSILEKPKGNSLVQVVNLYNLFFLLIVTPLAAILLITQRWDAFVPTHLDLESPLIFIALEIGGALLYVTGYFLMAWALIKLGGNYQLGGTDPRTTDELVIIRPYRFVRHPMYTAALGMSLGLAGLLHSLTYFAVFCIYLVLIILLIPDEERGLRKAYGEQYIAYQQNVKKLVPLLF